MVPPCLPQADFNDSDHSRRHWRHVMLGLAWAMFALSAMLMAAAVVGLCCAAAPSLSTAGLVCCCLCCPCCPGHALVGAILPKRNDACFLCAEVLCLGWLFNKLCWSDDEEQQHHHHHHYHYEQGGWGPELACPG